MGGIEKSSEVPKFRGSEVPRFEVARFEVARFEVGAHNATSSSANDVIDLERTRTPELRNLGTRNLGSGPRLAARAVACLPECHHEDAERDPRCGDPLHPLHGGRVRLRSTRKVAAIPIPITRVSAAASIAAAAIRTPPTAAASMMATGRAWTRRVTATVTTSGAKGRYRSADRGYDRRYGSRSEWQRVYRSGFTQGYDQGYRDAVIARTTDGIGAGNRRSGDR